MDKKLDELLESLKEINKFMENAIGTNELDKKIKDFVDAGINGEAFISIKKNKKNGTSEIKVEGTRPAILVGLAGAEKGILKQLDVPSGLFDLVKKSVGTKEAE